MHSRMRGGLRWFAVLAILALVLVACGEGAEETTTTTTTAAEPGETTTTAAPPEETTTTTEGPMGPTGVFSTYIGEPEHLVTLDANESEGIAVLDALYVPLITYDPITSEPAEGVAESIESPDGGLTYNITLKDGWTFHDGTPVTAESFAKTWNYGAYGPNAMQNAGFFSDIAGYEDLQCGTTEDDEGNDVADCENQPPAAEEMSGLVVNDPLSMTVTLSAPLTFWAQKIGYPGYSPLPDAFFADPEGFGEAPIGNGPFQMDGVWEHDQQIMLKAYEDFAGTNKAQVAGIEFRIYADVNTAINDLMAGELDIVDSVTGERADEVRNAVPNFDESPSSSINYLGFPWYDSNFGGDENKDLRAALSMAIDRQAITTAIFNDTRQPAFNLLSPVIPAYQEDVCENWSFNPERAKELYDASGGYEGTMVVWFNEGAGHDAWVEAVSNMWRETLGIQDFEFQQLQFADYLDRLDSQGVEGPFRLGWGMDYPHPQNYWELLLASWMTPDQGGANATFFENADFDAALEAALAEPDINTAIPLYQEVAAAACDNTPLIPMFYGQNQFAWNDTVSGVYVDAFGRLDYTSITVNG